MKGRHISDLKESSQIVGKLYPVLVDRDGMVIDGLHRLAADPNWPKLRLNHISSEKENLLARIVSNVCRRAVSPKEKKEMLRELGKICLEEGEKPGKIAFRIAEMTGMSYTWVMKYLPDEYKARPGLGGPSRSFRLDKCGDFFDKSQVTRRVTIDLPELFSAPRRNCVTMKTYANVNFVNLILNKKIYDNLERISERFGTTADNLISNAITLILKGLENINVENTISPTRMLLFWQVYWKETRSKDEQALLNEFLYRLVNDKAENASNHPLGICEQ